MFAKFSSWYLSKALELPSFHQWMIISLYFFDFFDFGLSWNDFGFLQLFLAFFWIFHWLLECSILLLAVGTPDV